MNVIQIQTGITTKKIFAEIMNRYSNIILTDSNNSIIGSLKYTGKTTYTLPSSDKKDILEVNDYATFSSILKSCQFEDLTAKITNSFTGISKSLIAFLLEKNKIDSKFFSENDIETIFNNLQTLLHSNSQDFTFVTYNNGNKNDFTLDIKNNDNNTNNTLFPLNDFIDKYYFAKENQENYFNEKYRLNKIISTNLKKSNKKLENIENKLKDCANMDSYRIYGELLNSNLYRISNVRANFVELENYYENNSLIRIPLDISLSVKKNAEKYFKKYRKLKNASQIVLSQKDDTIKEISYLESILFSLNIASSFDDLYEIRTEINDTLNKKIKKQTKNNKKSLIKKDNYSFNIEKINIDGYTIYIGKNNKQNEYLTLKLASRNDIWFHVQTLSGSHIVLKTNNLDLTDDIIYKCASLAKKYSKGSNDLHVSVDYTYIKNIKKSPVGKPGMVIYNTYKTIIV